MIENVVSRRITIGGKIIKWLMLGLCGITFLAAVTSVNFLPSFLITVGISWYYCRHFNLEFEYAFYGGLLTIDEIYAGKKRIRKLTVAFEEGKVERIVPFGKYEPPANKKVKVHDYASGYSDARVYVIAVNKGKYIDKIIFEPDDNLLKALYLTAPAVVVL